jgi:hypothetical protein
MPKSFTLEDLAKYSCEINEDSSRSLTRTLKRQGPGAPAVRNILLYSKALVVNESRIGERMFMLMN